MSEQKEALKLLSDLGQEWDAQAEITRLRAALADAQAVGFAAGWRLLRRWPFPTREACTLTKASIWPGLDTRGGEYTEKSAHSRP